MLCIPTAEENEDQYLKANVKPPTAVRSNKNCTMSFKISSTYRRGFKILTDIKVKISNPDGDLKK